jgi:hypothetical protein
MRGILHVIFALDTVFDRERHALPVRPVARAQQSDQHEQPYADSMTGRAKILFSLGMTLLAGIYGLMPLARRSEAIILPAGGK